MRFTKSLIALGAIKLALAHTIFTTFYVDGVSQGDGTCVRMNQTPNETSYPVQDLTSNDMACGITGETGVSRVCAANQSSTLTFQFREYADASQPGVIASSHIGPCAVYLKKVSSAITDPGYGDGWFKIWESGYDEDTQEWCTTKLINAGGLLSVDMPSDLAGGYYLVRPELLALHNAADLGDPQFYTGCAQMFLNSDATAVPNETVAIPGYVSSDDPSVTYNVYATPLSLPYPIPGPAVYEDSVASNIVGKRAAMEQTEGLKPEGCVLEVANWCGIELESYSTEKGCWNSSTTCWDESASCWADAGPTGGTKLCPIWGDHCTSIGNACNASDYNGPPNAGANLQPAPATIDLKLVSPSGVINVASSSAIPTNSSVGYNTTMTTKLATTSSLSATATTNPVSNVSSTTLAGVAAPSSSAAPESSKSADAATSNSKIVVTSLVTVLPFPSSSPSSVAALVIESSSQVKPESQTPKTEVVYETVWMTVIDYTTEGGGNNLVTLTPGSGSGQNSVPVATTTIPASPPPFPPHPVPFYANASRSGFEAKGVSTSKISAELSNLTTFEVATSSTTPSPVSVQTVTVTESYSYCPAETESSKKEQRGLTRHQAVHERRRAFENRLD